MLYLKKINDSFPLKHKPSRKKRFIDKLTRPTLYILLGACWGHLQKT